MAVPWNDADAYEAYVGRWSRALAPRFVQWAGVGPGAVVADIGCGTGALSEAVLAAGARSLVGFDLSAAHVEGARRRAPDPRARFDVADARALPLADASVDAVVSGLVLNFVPEPLQMLREIRRVLRPGGLAALYVWDYAGKMEVIRAFWDAAVALDEAARALDEAARFPLCEPAALTGLFLQADLRAPETAGLELTARFASFDDYWGPFLGAQGPAPAYVASLGAKAREALREELRARLPVRPDGSLALTVRAWGVKGRA